MLDAPDIPDVKPGLRLCELGLRLESLRPTFRAGNGTRPRCLRRAKHAGRGSRHG